MENDNEKEFLTKYYELINEHHGEINYNDYGAYIFSLFFLRYIYCKFQELYLEIVEDGCGLEEDIDVYVSEDIIYVPPEARWDYIVENYFSNENKMNIVYAMKSTEYSNETLKGITKELKFLPANKLKDRNILSIIHLIDDEKTNYDIFWFKILKRIFIDIVEIEKSTKFVFLNKIMCDLEYILLN